MTPTKSTQRHLNMLMTALGDDIAKLMQDDDIIEVMVNPDGKLWVDSLSSGKSFTKIVVEPSQVSNIIKLVAASRNLVADKNSPEVACELPESGARFQGWLPPVSSEPTFTIRKRAINIFTLDDYVVSHSLTAHQSALLKEAVKRRKNILIAGGTGSGKTTFANALLNELKTSKERLVVLEDLPELQVSAEDSVCLRSSEKKPMRLLVKGVLRMRPDRIIIGEVRDGSALELLKAWNTGHPGGICTIHANSPEATFARIEDLVQEAITVVPTRLIQHAVDIIVFMRKDDQGHYLIDSLNELVGYKDGKYQLHELR